MREKRKNENKNSIQKINVKFRKNYAEILKLNFYNIHLSNSGKISETKYGSINFLRNLFMNESRFI